MARKKPSLVVSEEKSLGSKPVDFQYQGGPVEHSTWDPPMDIYETDDDLVVMLEAAGMDEQSLKLHAIENRLVINGDRAFQRNESIQRYHQLEILFMPFQKTLVLSSEIEIETVEADYQNGMLHIRIPKNTLLNTKESNESE